jgi:integrase
MADQKMNIRIVRVNWQAIEDRRLKLAVHIALATGLREFEICKLRLEDLMENGACRRSLIVVGKKKNRATVYISESIRRAITDYVATYMPGQTTGYLLRSVLHDSPECRFSEATLKQKWRSWQKAQGQKTIYRFHDLRHTAITNFLNACGGNLRLTQMFARHTNINTTVIYTHPNESDLEAGIDKMGV